MYPYGAPQYPTPEQVPRSQEEMTSWVPTQPRNPVPYYGMPYQVPHVNVNVQVHRRVNHLLHGILTAATCGLWAPVWIYDVIRK